MAGDWIKVEKITPEKPEVVRMAALLKRDSDEIFGKLFKIWAWADDQSVDGSALQIDENFIDKKAGRKGFARAMRVVGWLAGESGSLTFPGFSRHNGETAKTRATGRNRVERHRKCNGKGVTDVTVGALGKALPEKRREELISPLPPDGGESEGGEDWLVGKIKSLRRRWGTGAVLDARDGRVFRKNREGWEAYGAQDWAVVAEFMRAALADGTAYTQPRNLNLALGMPGGLLAQARDWKSKQRPPLVVVPKPPVTEGPALNRAEIAEFLKIKS